MRRRFAIAWAVTIAACGSRTALVGDFIDDDDSSTTEDAALPTRDAAIHDAQPKLDGAPDVFTNDCPDASTTFIYLISITRELYSYNPVDNIFRDIGTVNCPTSLPSAFSMAVDRKGTAYVLFYDGIQDTTHVTQGDLFRVSTANASCEAIPEYVSGQQGFNVFGTGFATNGGGPSETFYVQGGGEFHSTTGLASIDTTTFQLTPLGNNNPPIEEGELTGTGDGRLFGFFSLDQTNFNLGEIDKTNGQLLSQTPLGNNIVANGGFSVAFWGGDFYFFTAPDDTNTNVTRYRPADQSFVPVATLSPGVIVGAGVSTCAPQ